MGHIHTQPGQHDFTVSAFIIRTDSGTPKAMLHIHKKLNVFLQFGGHVELDENPWQAIVREITEETGYNLAQLSLLQPQERLVYSGDTGSTIHPHPLALQTHPFGDEPHHHDDIAFAFVASEPPKHNPGQNESTDFRLLTVSELRHLKHDRIPSDVLKIFLFAIETCLPAWQQIPATSI